MQNILNVKERMETQVKNEFALRSAALKEEEDKLRILEDRKSDYELQLKELYSSSLDIVKITEMQNAIEVMKYQIQVQLVNVKNAQLRLEETRVRLQEAMLEKKTHEKLKEREFEQFMQDEAARESKEIDELVSFRFGVGSEE